MVLAAAGMPGLTSLLWRFHMIIVNVFRGQLEKKCISVRPAMGLMCVRSVQCVSARRGSNQK